MDTQKRCTIRQLFTDIAGTMPEYRRNWFYRIADASGLSMRVVEDAWYQGAMSTKTEWKLRWAAETARHENRNTAVRLQSIAYRLEKIDPDFHSKDVDTLRDLAARLGNLDKGK